MNSHSTLTPSASHNALISRSVTGRAALEWPADGTALLHYGGPGDHVVLLSHTLSDDEDVDGSNQGTP